MLCPKSSNLALDKINHHRHSMFQSLLFQINKSYVHHLYRIPCILSYQTLGIASRAVLGCLGLQLEGSLRPVIITAMSKK